MIIKQTKSLCAFCVRSHVDMRCDINKIGIKIKDAECIKKPAKKQLTITILRFENVENTISDSASELLICDMIKSIIIGFNNKKLPKKIFIRLKTYTEKTQILNSDINNKPLDGS